MRESTYLCSDRSKQEVFACKTAGLLHLCILTGAEMFIYSNASAEYSQVWIFGLVVEILVGQRNIAYTPFQWNIYLMWILNTVSIPHSESLWFLPLLSLCRISRIVQPNQSGTMHEWDDMDVQWSWHGGWYHWADGAQWGRRGRKPWQCKLIGRGYFSRNVKKQSIFRPTPLSKYFLHKMNKMCW